MHSPLSTLTDPYSLIPHPPPLCTHPPPLCIPCLRVFQVSALMALHGESFPDLERELRHVLRKARLLYSKGRRVAPGGGRVVLCDGDPRHFDLLASALELLGDSLVAQRRLSESESVRREILTLIHRRPEQSGEGGGGGEGRARYLPEWSAYEALSEVLILHGRSLGGSDGQQKIDEGLRLGREALASHLATIAEEGQENEEGEAAFARARHAAQLLDEGVQLHEAAALMALAERECRDLPRAVIHEGDAPLAVQLQVSRYLLALAEDLAAGGGEGARRALAGLEAKVTRAQTLYPAGERHDTAVWARQTLDRARARAASHGVV